MTAEEQKTRELNQCGMTYEELDAEAGRWGGDHSRLKLALSYLSDAQEQAALIAVAVGGEASLQVDRAATTHRHKENIRQWINCAKYLIDQEIVLGAGE